MSQGRPACGGKGSGRLTTQGRLAVASGCHEGDTTPEDACSAKARERSARVDVRQVNAAGAGLPSTQVDGCHQDGFKLDLLPGGIALGPR